MSQYPPQAQWLDSHTVGLAPSELVLVETSPNVYELSNTLLDADAVLVLGSNVVQIDNDLNAAGAISTILLGTTAYLAD